MSAARNINTPQRAARTVELTIHAAARIDNGFAVWGNLWVGRVFQIEYVVGAKDLVATIALRTTRPGSVRLKHQPDHQPQKRQSDESQNLGTQSHTVSPNTNA